MFKPPSGAEAIQRLNDLATKVGEIIANSPAADLERNARAHFIAQLAQQGLVTRTEFDAQKALLENARQQLAKLDAKIAALEAQQR